MIKSKGKKYEGLTSIRKSNLEKRNAFFTEIWKERPHKSEISGKKLYEPISTLYFHHILPKSSFPEAEYDKENVILVTGDEHSNVEMDIYKYEEINKRREYLKTKYKL